MVGLSFRWSCSVAVSRCGIDFPGSGTGLVSIALDLALRKRANTSQSVEITATDLGEFGSGFNSLQLVTAC